MRFLGTLVAAIGGSLAMSASSAVSRYDEAPTYSLGVTQSSYYTPALMISIPIYSAASVGVGLYSVELNALINDCLGSFFGDCGRTRRLAALKKEHFDLSIDQGRLWAQVSAAESQKRLSQKNLARAELAFTVTLQKLQTEIFHDPKIEAQMGDMWMELGELSLSCDGRNERWFQILGELEDLGIAVESSRQTALQLLLSQSTEAQLNAFRIEGYTGRYALPRFKAEIKKLAQRWAKEPIGKFNPIPTLFVELEVEVHKVHTTQVTRCPRGVDIFAKRQRAAR